ncbi:MAG: GrpB family protein [Ilumatobacteraceae bacterium]
MTGAIEVVEYDPRWAAWFGELATLYTVALRAVPHLAIEHVGSTSVPGLAAKPVIDVDIVVERPHVEAAIGALEAIGYESRGEMGIVDRWAMGAPAGSIRTNTYVVVDGSVALHNHLAVRDALRADGALRDEYGALKRRLAAETDDIDVYIEAKSPILQRILAAAGLSADDRSAIEAANRPDPS